MIEGPGDYLAYARRGRTRWWQWLLTAVVFAFLVVAIIVIFALAQAFMNILPGDVLTQMTNPSKPAVFFPANGVVFLIMAAALAAAALLIQAKGPMDLIGRWSWRQVAQAAAIWLVVGAVCIGIDTLLAPGSLKWTGSGQTLALLLYAAIGLGMQTFVEEFVFRGFLTQGLLLLLKRPLPAALVSAALFGSAHIPNGWPQAAGACLFGLATALLAIRLAGLAFVWGLHLANNLFGSVVVVSNSDVFKGAPALLTQSTPQLLWVDVGLEAAGLTFVIWLVFRWTRTPLSWLLAPPPTAETPA